MIKKFTKFFTTLRAVVDEDEPVLRWLAIIALFFVLIVAFSYMKMIFGIILLAYIALLFMVFLFGEIKIIKETDEYVEKEYNFWNISIKVKNYF